MRRTIELATVLGFATLLVAGAVSAQDAPAAAPAETPAPSSQALPTTDPGARIDEILKGEEAVLQGMAYSYDPGNRRDPFKSLEEAQNRPEVKGPLPEGIPGLLIDEIDLAGIYRTSKGFVAQVSAPNKNKSYLLRAGDQLYDGDVVRISQHEIVFKQIVNDPTVLKPFREVVKKLTP